MHDAVRQVSIRPHSMLLRVLDSPMVHSRTVSKKAPLLPKSSIRRSPAMAVVTMLVASMPR